jgi:holliday junction DNA helicase RuvA
VIAHVRGTLVARGAAPRDGTAHVVVDVGGVGYLVLVPAGLVSVLPPAGSEVTVHTSLQVREDAMTLYGFPSEDARDLFELLVTANGVGPRLALASLSTHVPTTLRRAIAEEDIETLTQVPGVGKKLAQRLVLDLRERVGAVAVDGGGGGSASPGTGTGGPRTEARLALLELGYSAAEADRALETTGTPNGEDGRADDVSAILRAALRALAGAGR